MVFAIILIISIVQWFVDGKKNFTGPRINIESLQNGEVIGVDPISALPDSSLEEQGKDLK